MNNYRGEPTPGFYPPSLHDKNSNNKMHKVIPPVPEENEVLEDYRDIKLPITSGFGQGKPLKDLTHPSDIRKRIRAAKQRDFQGGREKERGGVMETPQKKRRKLEEQQQWDVFRHLATLRRKQKCIEERDSQEVPTSPLVDPAPGDYISLHSSQSPSGKKPIGRRFLFDSEQCLHTELSSSPRSGFSLVYESPSPSHPPDNQPDQPLLIPTSEPEVKSEINSCVPSLEGFVDREAPLQVAQVPVLLQSYSLRPHLTLPPPLASPPAAGNSVLMRYDASQSSRSCSESEPPLDAGISILHVFPREE